VGQDLAGLATARLCIGNQLRPASISKWLEENQNNSNISRCMGTAWFRVQCLQLWFPSGPWCQHGRARQCDRTWMVHRAV
jgi:hypothetical protein